MRTLMAALCVISTAATGSGSAAAQKPAETPNSAKTAPACAALAFRPLPSGTTDGEQTAGTYKSRFARLELSATVQSGSPVTYYLAADGKRIPGGSPVPQAAADCAAAKKMPKPGTSQSSCTGERFTSVLVHAGEKRIALLYALNGDTWKFCDAGTF
jgi:hypothetical protein